MMRQPLTAGTADAPLEVALDTDIGSDVDDLLALAVILGSPELDLKTVATVYGDTALRARIVAKMFAEAGRPAPLIVAGLSDTRSGREVWWPGHEGSTIVDLAAQAYDADRDAVLDLAASASVVPIGPLTNIAAAIETPECRIARIVMMGGAFDGRTEHNIRSDVDAADVVFRSAIPLVTVGIEQTERVRFTEAELDGLAGPLGSLLDGEVRRYWSFAEQEWNTPHDPVAVVMLASPELFGFERGTITVVRGGEGAGVTRFEPDPAGPHHIVTDFDVDAVSREIVARIRTACEASARRRDRSPSPATRSSRGRRSVDVEDGLECAVLARVGEDGRQLVEGDPAVHQQ
ncbi:nucleoside hydrolase [Herbiconiux sp. L3-i23]|uniref:nucleoside hydrolase n=1 Tax=Herbiconiux sp. L3-i23 TaxID=2905871 RepID=UPI0020731621|nr:nucleoside hydrolase [Herbiconiux sp. L3-i23]